VSFETVSKSPSQFWLWLVPRGTIAVRAIVIQSDHSMSHRCFQDNLPTSPSVSTLRASGLVDRNTKSVVIAFGEGADALWREIRVTHRQFPNGGGWSFFACPRCSRRARVLKIYDGLPMCWRCCAANGVRYRSAGGSTMERDAARTERIERLRGLLDGYPARLHPRPGRVLDRRRGLETSLQRARTVQRIWLRGFHPDG
jgi:hypothetical protein